MIIFELLISETRVMHILIHYNEDYMSFCLV